MEARLPKGIILKKVFDAIREMVGDINLECTESGISVQSMDASHVSLVALNMAYGAFENYRCSRVRTLGLNMLQVGKVFKLCGNDDQVIIRNDDESEYVSFVFECHCRSCTRNTKEPDTTISHTPERSPEGLVDPEEVVDLVYPPDTTHSHYTHPVTWKIGEQTYVCAAEDKVSDFELRLMQIDAEHLGVPESEFDAKAVMPAKNFAKVVTDMGQFAESIIIEITPKGIKFTAKGDFGTGNTLYKASGSGGAGSASQEDVEIRTETTTSLTFATRYLTYFTKAASLANNVTLEMSAGQPLAVTYLLDNDESVGTLKFYLAPKMDDVEA